MAAELDEQVVSFRNRPLGDAGPFTFVAADALTLTSPRRWSCGQRGGPDRYPGSTLMDIAEVLGLRVATTESSAAWNGLLADLVARGLTGVRLVTSDAHTGLVEAIAANLPGATWQRCRTHYAANLMTVVPKSLWPAVKAMLHWRLRPARRSSRRGSVRPPPGLRPHDPARGCRPPRSRTSRPAGLPPPSLSRYGDRSGPTTPKNASTESPWVLWRLGLSGAGGCRL